MPESIHDDLMAEMANLVTIEEIESHRPWSNLSADVLGEIMQLMSVADQIRFSCVCKNFLRLPLHHDRPVDLLPWFVTCHDSGSDGFVCKLFDPLHKKPYGVYRITAPGMEFFRPDYVTSKDGWLLFLREKGRHIAELFLFCPYTKEIILLPDLRHGFWETKENCFYAQTTCICPDDRLRIVTFSSSDPKSEECVFFAAYYLYDGMSGKMNICSYRHKDKGWKTKRLYALNFIKICNLVYSRGNLYCMNTNGCLGIYNVRREEWSFFNSWPNVAVKHGLFSLVTYEGTLLLAVLDDWPICQLYRLRDSSSDKEWVRQNVLENQALFLGHHPWECAVLVPKALGDLEFVGNKIFYRKLRSAQLWRFYDFNGSENGACDGTEFEIFVPREEEKEALLSKDNDPLALWIEPPNHALKRLMH